MVKVANYGPGTGTLAVTVEGKRPTASSATVLTSAAGKDAVNTLESPFVVVPADVPIAAPLDGVVTLPIAAWRLTVLNMTVA